MGKLRTLNTFADHRGNLSVAEKLFEGDIKRVFYIYQVPDGDVVRGEHGHFKANVGLVCVAGSCRVTVQNETGETVYFLSDPAECLMLEPADWHAMDRFSANAVLLVLCDAYFDDDDYNYNKPVFIG